MSHYINPLDTTHEDSLACPACYMRGHAVIRCDCGGFIHVQDDISLFGVEDPRRATRMRGPVRTYICSKHGASCPKILPTLHRKLAQYSQASFVFRVCLVFVLTGMISWGPYYWGGISFGKAAFAHAAGMAVYIVGSYLNRISK